MTNDERPSISMKGIIMYGRSDDDKNQMLYGSMARMYGNNESYSRYFSDSSKLTNCI